MGTVVVRKVRDRDEWNTLVLRLPNYDLKQGYEWSEMQREAGWTAHRYAVANGSSWTAAVSILARHLPGLGYAILYAPRGPLVHRNDDVGWSSLMDTIHQVAARTHAIFLRVSPGVPRERIDLHEALLRNGFIQLPDNWTTWNTPRIIMTLDVAPAEPELRKRMHDSTRLYLERAVKRGGVIESDTSAEGMERLHRLLVKAGNRKGLPVRPLQYFEALRRAYLVTSQGYVPLATYHGSDLAGLLAVRFGRKAYLLYSAIDTEREETRILRPGSAVHWAMIQWAKASGCEMIDWGGSGTDFPPRAEDPGLGIYQFKRGFGCSLDYMIGYYDLVFRPGLYRAFRFAERRLLPLAWDLRAKLNSSA